MTLAAYIAAYETLGYAACGDDGSRDPGFEKVAIYVDAAGVPSHAARQLADGRWASKLGQGYDIVHDDAAGVGGDHPAHGEVAVFMRRPEVVSPSQ